MAYSEVNPEANYVFLRTLSRDKLMRTARERKQQFLSRPQQELHRFLVPTSGSNDWSNKNSMYGKLNIPTLLTGKESSRRDSHSLHIDSKAL